MPLSSVDPRGSRASRAEGEGLTRMETGLALAAACVLLAAIAATLGATLAT